MNYIFHDPNPQEALADLLVSIVVEAGALRFSANEDDREEPE